MTFLAPSSAAIARAARIKRELAAQAVGADLHAQRRRTLDHLVGQSEIAVQGASFHDAIANLRVLLRPRRSEALGVAIECIALAHDGNAIGEDGWRLHVHRKTEAVEQLGPQFAFFGVAGSDQHEARGVADAQAFALDDVLAGGRHIEQQIDKVVFEQVHFVDVKEAAMRLRQQARLEAFLAARQRRSRSSAPTTRSSVAPSGRSTTGVGRNSVFTAPLAVREGQSGVQRPASPLDRSDRDSP